MSRAAIRQAVESRLSSNWATTPIAWDNVYFSPPANAAFIRCTVLFGDEQQVSMLNGYRQNGIIDIAIFAPVGVGTATVYTYADTLSNIFRGKQFSGVSCRGANTTRVPSLEKGWFQLNVSIPFYTDTIY
jgi:hypothetical protein